MKRASETKLSAKSSKKTKKYLNTIYFQFY
jgi:hypothetical protein